MTASLRSKSEGTPRQNERSRSVMRAMMLVTFAHCKKYLMTRQAHIDPKTL